MCNRPECPTPEKSKHVRWKGDPAVTENPLYTPGVDDFPDGFHAKPMRLWDNKPQKKRADPSATLEELKAERDSLMADWAKLPEPRPDPMDYAAYATRWDQWFELRVISKMAPLYGDRIKASSTLLDFAKTRPKQQFELVGDDLAKASDHELLRKALEANGLPASLAEELKRSQR